MMTKKKDFLNQKIKIILITLFCVGAFLRLYNFDWGSPFYFHPDERNIASSVADLHAFDQLNPHFFAYGSLPIYTIYTGGVFVNMLLGEQKDIFFVSLEIAIRVSRVLSAALGISIILLAYFVGKNLHDAKTGLLAAFFTTFSTGFIQFSHFGTFEMWLTFFSLLLFFIMLFTIKNDKRIFVFLLGIVFGILVSIKVTALIFFVPICCLVFYKRFIKHKTKLTYSVFFLSVLQMLRDILLILCLAAIVYLIFCPFTFKTYNEFIASMRYESAVALGRLPVFYTGGFTQTIPILFQFNKIYPFFINPLLTIIFIPCFLFFVWKSISQKNIAFIMLSIVFLSLFLSQAVQYAKWTRYMLPTLPFLYLILSYVIVLILSFIHKQSKNILFWGGVLHVFVFSSMLFSLAFFLTVYTKEDTRVAASEWAKKNIKENARILSEVYDLGILPFNNYFPHITLFNFYDLEQNPLLTKDLAAKLAENDYLILTSQRIMKNRLAFHKKFPLGHDFYSKLFAEKNGYKKIYQTPCDILCQIAYFGNPMTNFEETATVFDRPIIFIFKKI